MFNIGSLAASLRLDGMGQFEGDLQKAGDALDRAGNRGASFGRAGEAAVRKAAGATVALTAAAGAYLTILTRTGVEYNSLQQNSRAALSTLLGGAEQANAQMDKLDAFAKNSPFSKSVFIGAQQQLIAFGVEARKVIPYLDGIQNAIAASGGSNADLEAVVTTIAKIQSSAKITAQDFIEFGNRGINAAELIGTQMGKTGAEIRESVTEGTLDATEAMDALVAGMTEKFGGATDLIKQQWSGATDRIKAANRDIGAAIAEPFVSAQGGGMAVTWANQVADVLRAIEKQAVPVMSILTNRGMPIFSGITTGLDDLQRSIQTWDSSKLERFFNQLPQYAPAVGLLVGYMGALGSSVGPLGALFGTLGLKVNPVLGAFVGLAAASPEVRAALSDVLEVTKPLGPVFADLGKVLAGQLTTVMPVLAGGIGLVVSVAKPLVSIIEKIPAPLLAGVAAFLALKSVTNGLDLGPVNKGVSTFFSAIKESDAVRAFNAGLSPTSSLLAGVGQAGNAAKAGVANLGNALQAAFMSNPVGLAITAVSLAIGIWAAANAEAERKVQEHNSRVSELRGTLDETTASMTDASRAMVAEAVAAEDAADKLSKAGASSTLFTQALVDGGAAADEFKRQMVSSAEGSIRHSSLLDEARGVAAKLGVSYETVIQHLLGFGEATEEVNDAINNSGQFYTDNSIALDHLEGSWTRNADAQKDVVALYEQQRVAIADAQTEQKRLNEAMADARMKMSDAGRAVEDYNAASSVATDSTKTLEERVRALKTAYDILTGGASSAAEAQARVDASNLALAEGFAKVDEEGVSMWGNAISMAEETTNYIDTSTRAGQELFRALQDQQNNTLQASILARDTAINNGKGAEEAFEAARAAATEYNQGLSNTLTEAGLVGEAHQKLYDAWAIDPEVAAFTVTDNGTMDELTLRALQLAIAVGQTPDKTIIVDDPNSPEIIGRLEDLGYKIDTLPDGKIQITATGDVEVETTLQNLTTPRSVSIFLNPIRNGSDEEWKGIPYKLPGQSLTGNLFSGGVAQAFATGGMAPGFYKAPPGAAAIHKFAEQELAWEAYISPKPGFKDRNIKIGMEALARLGEPVIPISALRGIPGFATGGGVAQTSSPQGAFRPVPQSSRQRSSRREAPVVGRMYVGMDADRNDIRELVESLDRFSKEW